MTSNQKLLLEAKLGYSVERWMDNAEQQGLSYRQMSAALLEETGIEVSKSSLHLWWTK